MKYAAEIKIPNVSALTPEQRADVVRWLRSQADLIAHHGKGYTGNFESRIVFETREGV